MERGAERDGEQELDYPRVLRDLRTSLRLTQAALAERLGVTCVTVNGWENGKHVPMPALAGAVTRLARRAGVLPGPGEEKTDGVVPRPPNGKRLAAGKRAATSDRNSPDPGEVAPVPAGELSGWPPTERERRDLYHRVREFPDAVAGWRRRLAEHVMRSPDLFPAVSSGATPEDIRSRLDDGISYLREIARILAVLHGTPDLGNKPDPVDELVYIILARKTREEAYQQTFELLISSFPTWDELLDTPREEVEKLVHGGGLSGKKTASLYGALGRLRETFGHCTLEPARAWSDERLEEFLCSLPEIQRKSAYCIMMYSMGRGVFPVDTHVGRVLSRLGPYRELGLELEGLDHKKLQKVLAELIPPNLRYSLHVNLIQHGRQVCHAIRPRCDRCELRSFCGKYRQDTASKTRRSRRPTVVDLFCGAGGLSTGFEAAGFRTILAVDQDPVALRTYWLNHPSVEDSRIICRDIGEIGSGEFRRLARRERVDVLVAAPPCQGFSAIGKRSKKSRKELHPDREVRVPTSHRIEEDHRTFLFTHVVRAALELRPRLLLMENVPGMASARGQDLSFLELAAQELEKKGGFRTSIWRLNASAFGVPQDRIRFFLVASSTEHLPASPAAEYQDLQKPEFDVEALPPVTLEEAIFDLPARGAGEGIPVDVRKPVDLASDPRYRRYLAKFGLTVETGVLYNHTVRYHNRSDLELYALLKPGEDSVHVLEKHGREDLMRYRTDAFDDKYARLRPDRPCKTIVSHLAKDGNGYIHPKQVRSITLREAARVQSFPDTFAFCGSSSDQWIQLGNAVPPLLARTLAGSFLNALEEGD